MTLRLPRIVTVTMIAASVIAAPGPVGAASFTFPGPGCRSTLQACIDQAPGGSTIRIARNTVDEKIKINKSLTLTKAPGFTPTLGGGNHRTLKIFSPTRKPVHVTLNRLTFENVDVLADLEKGGGDSVKVLNSVVTGGTTPAGDAGVAIVSEGKLQAQIKNSRIVGNNVPLFIGTSAPFGFSNFAIENNVITSKDDALSQAALQVSGSGGGVVNATIRNNLIHDVSGCICGNPAAVFLDIRENIEGNYTVTNNTIDDTPYAGIWHHVDTSPGKPVARFKLFNNTISDTPQAFFAPPPGPNNEFLNGYNNFYNTPPPNFGSWQEGPGTISQAPMFADDANADYRLQATSPLVDTGNYLVPGGVSPLDILGNARVNRAQVDIGAYEYDSRPGCTIIGTGGGDEINGTPGRDIICGDSGSDILRGRAGGDQIIGGAGEDTLWGDGGADVLRGGDDPDVLRGLDGVKGNDKLFGQGSTDDCLADALDKMKSC